jgi:nucleoside triphosphate pyrophosphatase
MRAQLILASGSASRRSLLAAAGLAFETVPPSVNEEEAKHALAAKQTPPSEIASALAELKAMQVSKERRGAFVLGADQLLVCDGARFDKAVDMASAKHALKALRGRRHELITAVVLAKNGTMVWRQVETASLWMREFSDAFLDTYLATEGEAILGAVGCYRLEGQGAQLFSRVEGDAFAIQGLPLLATLKALREHGAIAQ